MTTPPPESPNDRLRQLAAGGDDRAAGEGSARPTQPRPPQGRPTLPHRPPAEDDTGPLRAASRPGAERPAGEQPPAEPGAPVPPDEDEARHPTGTPDLTAG